MLAILHTKFSLVFTSLQNVSLHCVTLQIDVIIHYAHFTMINRSTQIIHLVQVCALVNVSLFFYSSQANVSILPSLSLSLSLQLTHFFRHCALDTMTLFTHYTWFTWRTNDSSGVINVIQWRDLSLIHSLFFLFYSSSPLHCSRLCVCSSQLRMKQFKLHLRRWQTLESLLRTDLKEKVTLTLTKDDKVNTLRVCSVSFPLTISISL